MEIYRSEKVGLQLNTLNPPRPTMRLPGNVPYVVDNLWEWQRPEGYPNRRNSVYASPCPKLASELGREGGQIYRVNVCGNSKIAQLQGYTDSKFHPDCKDLKKGILRLLGISGKDSFWHRASLSEKEAIGRLWIPGLTKDQVEELFSTVSGLNDIKDSVAGLIRYWKDVKLIHEGIAADSTGEIFFESDQGYTLSAHISADLTQG